MKVFFDHSRECVGKVMFESFAKVTTFDICSELVAELSMKQKERYLIRDNHRVSVKKQDRAKITWNKVVESMKSLGFSTTLIEGITRILCSVVHLVDMNVKGKL